MKNKYSKNGNDKMKIYPFDVPREPGRKFYSFCSAVFVELINLSTPISNDFVSKLTDEDGDKFSLKILPEIKN